MTMLQELGNLGDFVGGIAVVATLVYLALQIRQNTATTRVQTVQHLLTSDTLAADSTIAGPVPEILAKLVSGEKLSRNEVSAYSIFMRGRVTEAWQVFYQRQNGMIEPDVADALLGRFEYYLQFRLFEGVWNESLRLGFPPEFQDYVESVITRHRADGDAPAAQPSGNPSGVG